MPQDSFKEAIERLKSLLPKGLGFRRKRRQALLDALDALAQEHADLKQQNRQLRENQSTSTKKARDLSSFYLAFENRYRGSVESIRDKLRPYLDDFQRFADEKDQAKILDIGCGRGEWLSLLNKQGFSCIRGVDSNRNMLEACQSTEIELIESDVFAYLKSTPENTYDAITAFHVIEHFDFEEILELLELTLAALRPNGIAILETPNPRNLIVGGNTFYFDPTHIRPVPCELLGCAAEHLGFTVEQIYQRNAYPDLIKAADSFPADAKLLRNTLSCGLDYGVVLSKPSQ